MCENKYSVECCDINEAACTIYQLYNFSYISTCCITFLHYLYIICLKFVCRQCAFLCRQQWHGIEPGRMDWQTDGLTVPAWSVAQDWRSSAPESLRAALADSPEDWPAASPCDASTMITLKPKSHVIYCVTLCPCGCQLFDIVIVYQPKFKSILCENAW